MDMRVRPMAPVGGAIRPVVGGYRLLAARPLSGDENHGMHNVFVRVVGPDGKGLNGVTVLLQPEGEDRVVGEGRTHDKDYPFRVDPARPGVGDGDPRGDQAGWIDFPLNKGPRYQVKVIGPDGVAIAGGFTTLLPDGQPGNTMGHYSYLVVFQAGAASAAAPPAAPPAAVRPPEVRPPGMLPPAGRPLPSFLREEPAPPPVTMEPDRLRLVAWIPAMASAPGPALVPAPAPAPAPASPASPVQAGAAWRLDQYPAANPVGAHGLPNYLQSAADGDFVLDLLAKTGAKNTLLIVPFPGPATLRDVDRDFLVKAKARGVTVQLRLGFDMKPGNDTPDPAALQAYVAEAARALGAPPYVQIGNEPNLAGEWANGRKPDAAAFAAWWARYARAVADGGGLPGLPGLAAGAYDTPDGNAKQEHSFYEAMLQGVVAKDPTLLDRAWTSAHPYHMYADAGHADYVEDLTWQLGRFDAMNRAALGRSLPVLVTESGWVDGANARRFDPGSTAQAEDTARFKRSLATRPPWLVVGTADWLIANRHGENWKSLYGPNGERSAFAQVLEAHQADWAGLRDDVRRP